MLYILSKTDSESVGAFETHTNSFLKLDYEELTRLIDKCGFEVKNAKPSCGLINLNKWPHKLVVGANENYYTAALTTEVEPGVFKIARCGDCIIYVDKNKLEALIGNNQISNCGYKETSSGIEYSTVDTYNTPYNKEFTEYIDNEYRKFIAKAKLLGLDNTFDYRVENNSVILTYYTGESKTVILPNFITSIGNKAFYFKEMKKIGLSNNIEYIGDSVFCGNELRGLVIPEKTKFIGQYSFTMSKRKLDKSNVTLESESTVVFDWDIASK